MKDFLMSMQCGTEAEFILLKMFFVEIVTFYQFTSYVIVQYCNELKQRYELKNFHCTSEDCVTRKK